MIIDCRDHPSLTAHRPPYVVRYCHPGEQCDPRTWWEWFNDNGEEFGKLLVHSSGSSGWGEGPYSAGPYGSDPVFVAPGLGEATWTSFAHTVSVHSAGS